MARWLLARCGTLANHPTVQVMLYAKYSSSYRTLCRSQSRHGPRYWLLCELKHRRGPFVSPRPEAHLWLLM